jgi:hypothetical protein
LSNIELILRDRDVTQEELCQSIASEAKRQHLTRSMSSRKLHVSTVQL